MAAKKKRAIVIPAWLRKSLSVASTLAAQLPTKQDTIPGVIVKVAAMMGTLNTVLVEGRMDTMILIARERELVLKQSEPFVSIYFNSLLHEAFEETRILDHQGPPSIEILHCKHAEYGEVYFIRSNSWGQQATMRSFYHTKGFDFTSVLGLLWTKYDGRIQATVNRTPFAPWAPPQQSSTYTQYAEIPNPLYGKMHEKMTKLVERQRRFKLDGTPRSYMFYGPPGTGKSSFAEAFAERLGERTLRIDATAIANMSVDDVDFLIKSLHPDFLLVDDIDKANMGQSLATLLSILQRFKTDYPKLTVLITANAIDRFDPGFFRPGRIDTWVEFEPPDDKERETILRLYCENLKVPTKDEEIASLVAASDGLTQDYIRELAYELRCDDIAHVLERVAQMRALLNKTIHGGNGVPKPGPALGVPFPHLG